MKNEEKTIAAQDPETPTAAPSKKPRGFAAMDPAKVRAIAASGGKAAHAAGTAHTFTLEEAKRAGSIGGKASRRGRKKEA